MLPRRTFRSTSRTAKKPANSLVNPWVSRMNSSANQISPISRHRDVPSRVTDLFVNRQVPQGAAKCTLEIRPGNPFPDRRLGAEYAVNGEVYARSNARHAAWAPVPPAPPLVELRKLRNRPVCRNFYQRRP